MDLTATSYRNIEIRETLVGSGVFSLTGFAHREIVSEIKGQVLLDTDYESDYCMDLGQGALLEPDAPFRYVNHSCDPNCELILWKKRRHEGRKLSRLWLQTLRAIQPDEELTIDYAWPAEAAVPCRCHSRQCRGWIVHRGEVGNLLLP